MTQPKPISDPLAAITMRTTLIFIVTILSCTFISDSLIAQVDTFSISDIKKYRKFIDSLTENDEKQKFVVQSIAEGRLTQEMTSTSIVGFNSNRDTIRTIKAGGFGKYTIRNIRGDTVYRIIYHDNINKNFYETFYYRDNQLVYAKVDYQEDGIGKTFYYKEEYYKNGEVIFVNESKCEIDDVFRQRVNFNFQKKGSDYFKSYKEDSKSR